MHKKSLRWSSIPIYNLKKSIPLENCKWTLTFPVRWKLLTEPPYPLLYSMEDVSQIFFRPVILRRPTVCVSVCTCIRNVSRPNESRIEERTRKAHIEGERRNRLVRICGLLNHFNRNPKRAVGNPMDHQSLATEMTSIIVTKNKVF